MKTVLICTAIGVGFVLTPILFAFVLESMRHRYEKKWRDSEPPTHRRAGKGITR